MIGWIYSTNGQFSLVKAMQCDRGIGLSVELIINYCLLRRPNLMKLFAKEVKKIVVNNYEFLCVIDLRPEKDFISFKIYPSETKISYFLIIFSWKINWATNLCAKLIQHAISSGWNYNIKHSVFKVQNGDDLIGQLGLDQLDR